MTTALAFDHFVLVVSDVERSLAWYQQHLGLTGVRIEEWRRGEVPFPSLRVTPDTIIDFLHGNPAPGGALDHICFVVTPHHLEAARGALEVIAEGRRFGARGMATSIYVTDPDGLTVELRSYPADPAQ